MREPSYSGWRPLWEGMLALRDGRWDEAERCIGLVSAFTERAQHPNWIGSILAQLYTLRWGQGRLDELEPAILQNVQQSPLKVFLATLAHIRADAGRLDEAREPFDKLASDGLPGPAARHQLDGDAHAGGEHRASSW